LYNSKISIIPVRAMPYFYLRAGLVLLGAEDFQRMTSGAETCRRLIFLLNCILLNDVLVNILMIINTYFENGVYEINALR
jgi:uncharacterized membrane protein